MATMESAGSSPTTSIFRVLITGMISLTLVGILGAPGIVQAGEGMQDGVMRTATLAVGHPILQWTRRMHLDQPWNDLQAALGRPVAPAQPPLLAEADPAPVAGLTVSPWRRFSGVERLMRERRSVRPVMAADPPRVYPLRRPTRANPLRLLVAGDSLAGYLGPELIDEVAAVGPVRGVVDSHNGTGLTRPDFVDWSQLARQQVAADHPDAVVVMIGGNDFQNMVVPGGKVLVAGTPAWAREYARRAAVCMRIWAQGGRSRVYWLSMPPSRDSSWAQDDAQINIALRRAARWVPGAKYLDILGPVTDHGRYADFVSVNGQPVLVREPDGVHLNITGSTLVAHEVVPVIVREWHLRAVRRGRR